MFELKISIRSTVFNLLLKEWSEGKTATPVAFVSLKAAFFMKFHKKLTSSH